MSFRSTTEHMGLRKSILIIGDKVKVFRGYDSTVYLIALVE